MPTFQGIRNLQDVLYISTMKMSTSLFFRAIRLRTHATSYPRELEPQLHLSENLETFTYAVGGLVERSLTRDAAQTVRCACIFCVGYNCHGASRGKLQSPVFVEPWLLSLHSI
jgi:hypothetical protein